ncbi:phospholipid-transporting ATPase VB-like [Dermatophagoides pteronyssinus]|uniref:phospholipid-transporting ATPase VB-like n=1 Tax=Dermatophagoides pteronyssinus TaxID=6956 RepID=UPI003F676A55
MSPSKHKEPTKNVRLVTPNLILADENVEPSKQTNITYKANRINTSKYTWITFLPKNLFEQFYRFANLYFLFIQILNWLPGMEVFVREVQLMPLLFVLSVTAIKDLFEDRRRHLSDKRVNNMATRRYDTKTKRFVRIKWKEVQVGDLIHLACNEMVPADILLLRSQSAENEDYGTCYVETSNLDGESNLKPRYVVPDVIKPYQSLDQADFDFIVECEKPNLKLHKFNGSLIYNNDDGSPKKRIAINKDNILLRDCTLKNTGFAEGLVIYAGHESKAMLNNKGPRHKRSRLEKMMNRDIIMCVVILIIMCVIGFMGRYFWLDQFTDPKMRPPYNDYDNPVESLDFIWPLKTFATFLILYQMIIPISLYVCIEMVKLGQVYLINRDEFLIDKQTGKRCECRAWNITEDLGQIEYVFCDKTGTLTENIMEFQCCCIKGINYESDNPKIMNTTTKLINSQLCDKVAAIGEHYKKWKDRSNKSNDQNKDKDDDKKFVLNDDEQQIIHDFFITLAICNTATSQSLHQDNLNAKGQQVMMAELSEETKTVKTVKTLKGSLSLSSLFQPTDLFHVFQSPESMKKTKSNEKSRSSSTEDHQQTIGPCFESESPDEVALVTAAFQYQYRLVKRVRDLVTVLLPNNVLISYKVLYTLPFDSDRKRMSVIVRCPFTGQIILYTKGSDLTVLQHLSSAQQCNPANELVLNKQCLHNYSSKGLRVLCIAKRVLSQQQYDDFIVQVNKAESSENRDKKILRIYEELESDLQLLGSTAIEDRLQHRVPQVIKALRDAGIMVWVLTGDKMETAISIAKSCQLFNSDMRLLTINLNIVRSKKTARTELLRHLDTVRNFSRDEDDQLCFGSMSSEKSMNNNNTNSTTTNSTTSKEMDRSYIWLKRIYHFLKREKFDPEDDDNGGAGGSSSRLRNRWGLVIDGPSLNFVLQKDNVDYFIQLSQYCGSVLCCRVTPSQKSFVVKCVKNKLNVLTLAIGDGANDVAMIQTAAIGVGVVGLEGSQAAMASDFAIPRFHFLERLLLLHGNLCYNRLALTILYFFYKNTMVVFVLFFYQFLSGFSGTSLLDDVYLMAVNIFYTTIPAIVRGIIEKDCHESVFLDYPTLYERGRHSTVYTMQSFWVTTIDSVYQSSIIFFVTYGMFNFTSIGVYEFGLTIFILIIITNLLQIMMENKYWNQYFVLSIGISIGYFMSSMLFLDFNYSDSLLLILGGRNYKLFVNLVFEMEFWRALIVIPVICLLPRFTIRTLQNIVKPSFRIPFDSPGDKKSVSHDYFENS